MADKTASFAINLEGNAKDVSKEDAAALEELRQKIKSTQDNLKNYSEALRGLKGNSDEVKSAKEQLKAKIDALQQSLGKSKLEVLKLGTTYEQLRRQANAAKDGQVAMGKTLSAVGGPIQGARDKLEALKGMFGEGNAGAALLAGGVALLATAAVALVAALGAGVIAFARWAFGAADAARSMGLIREAATGSAQKAANLGTQIDALAKKIPTPKAELNALASELARTLNNTTLSGQGIVDTFNIVAQASAAMGQTVGKQLGDIIDRSKRFGRIQINPLELQGTGLKFQDVAASLAKNLNIGIGAAQKALFEGRVKINDGAKAIRDAVDKRFGEINARKLLSLDVIAQKVHETFDKLASGIRIEPLGAALTHFFKLFDSEQTGTGKGLKALVETLGNGLVKGLVAIAPLAELAFATLIGLLLDTGIAVLKTGLYLKSTFVGDALKGIVTTENAMKSLKVALYATGIVLGTIAAAVGIIIGAWFGLTYATYKVGEGIVWLGNKLGEIGTWLGDLGATAKEYGANLVDGFVEGITSSYDRVKGAIEKMSSAVKTSFKDALGIASPSKLFAEYGRNTAEGYAKGVDDGSPDAQAAVTAMVPAAPAGGGGARGGGPITNNFTFNVSGGGKPEAVVAALSAPSFLAQLTNAIEEAMTGAGVPTMAQETPA
jgi:hypothetical protein